MKVREIFIPSFLHSQVCVNNDGSTLSLKEVLKRETCAIIDAIDNIDEHLDECFIMCRREKINDDFIYHMWAFPPLSTNDDLISIMLMNTKNVKPILINGNAKIISIFEKIYDKLISLF